MGPTLTWPRRTIPCKTRFLCKPNSSEEPSNRNAFYHDFRAFWVLLKVFGLFPYKVNKTGDVTFNWVSKEMIMAVLTYAVTSMPVLMVLCLRYQQHMQFSGNFDREIHLYMFSMIMLPHLVVPLTHWSDMVRFQATFEKWHQFQIRYEETLNKKLMLKIHWSTQVFIISVMSFTCIAVIVQFFYEFSQYPWEVMANIYMLLFFIIHKLLFIGLCCRLTYVARSFRGQVLQTMKEENVELLAKMASLWISLSESIKLVGSLFYRTFSYMTLLLFCVSTIMMYSLLRSISNNIFKTSMLYNVACLTSNCMSVFLICESAERLTLEVGPKFVAGIGKLRSNIKNPEVRYEVDSFLATIATYPPIVTFNGYVIVDRKLLVTINSTMCTYLIVVLQFSQEYSEEREYNSTSTKY